MAIMTAYLTRMRTNDCCHDYLSAEEGVFHITNTPSGFYINRSTRQVFDPRPALHPHFSHEIFNTLLGVSASLRASWRQQSLLPSPLQTEAEEEARQAKGGDKLPGALDVISTICSQVKGSLSDSSCSLLCDMQEAVETPLLMILN